jgi:hypothetical protein
MIIMIGLAKKPKKKAGGKVEGGAARRHLGKRARGGPADGPRVLDAREDAREPGPNGRDKVPQQSGTEERAVEMGDPRKRGGGIHIKPSHRGMLHKEMGVPAGEKIPTSRLEKAKEGASPAERKRITFAENAKHWNH